MAPFYTLRGTRLFKITHRKLKNILFTSAAWLLILLWSTTTQAGLFGISKSEGPKAVSEVFILDTQVIDADKLLLRWEILDNYYLYDNKMKFSAADGVTVKEISRSKSKSKDDPLFGKVEVYYQMSEIILQLSGVSITGQVDLSIEYQGCWDGGVCYPPVIEQLSVKFAAQNVDESAGLPAKAQAAKSPNPGEQGRPNTRKVLESQQDYFSNLLIKGDFFWVLAAFFAAGLALSLTPCVFPMIPILSSIIAGQGESVTKAKAFVLTVIYVLSVSFTYTLAGVLAGLFGENLQVLFQATWIIVLFSAIFMALALSMFGLYELQLPTALQSKLASLSNNQQGGNYIGVAVMGVLSALIVGPCMAAPLAGALIYIGQSADPVMGGFALFSLSLGMGVPLILVGVSAGHLMPKVGAWMNSVKAAFGVLLVLMAIYMIDRVVSIDVTMFLTAITLILTAVFMGAFNVINNTSTTLTKLAKALSLVFLIYGLSLLIGFFIGNGNLIKPLKGLAGSAGVQTKNVNQFTKITSLDQLSPLLAQAKRQGRPVMLDFYADWCISCVELEYMLEEDEVARVLKEIRLVKVDLTDYNAEAKALVEKYQVLGPPALAFYNKKGVHQQSMTRIGLLSATEFLQHIAPLRSVK